MHIALDPNDDRPSICSGMTVIDLSTVVSGPFCTQVLGDLGADVIKIETPIGDFSRLTAAASRAGLTGFFATLNRNKRSISVDLKAEAGQAVARRLVKNADVLVENYRPGVAERLGLGYEALREINPRLVYVAISGFGPDGPYASLPAYDNVIQGLTGAMPTQGGDGPPRMIQSVAADKASGLTAVSAVLGALLARERGIASGQRVDVPMLDAYAAFMLTESVAPHSFPPDVGRPGNTVDLYRTWKTADGYAVGIMPQDDQFQALCRALARPDLAGDPRYATIAERLTNVAELYAILEAEIEKLPTEEFVRRARAEGAPFAPANDFDDFAADPQVKHNGTLFEADDPLGGRARYLRNPVRYADTPAALRRHPPRLGEHTDEILEAAGFSAEEVAELRSSGVVR